MDGHRITMLGTGLIGDFYTKTLHGQRSRDEVRVVYSRSEERGAAFRERWGIAESTTDLAAAIEHPDTDVVVIGVPNFLHEEAVGLAATGRQGRPVHEAARADRRGGAPDARGRGVGRRLRRLPRGPVLHAQDAQGDRLGPRAARSATSPGSAHARRIPARTRAWFWDGRLTGGGAIIDLGCHCIEIIRNFVGKGNRPVEVLCHTDTLVHPIADEDNAVALIRFESGAIGQFEVSWTFRGGMDLRDEVAGTHGTIWLNHFLRTGFEMFTRRRPGRLRRREGRDVGRLAVPGRRRGVGARLRRHVQRHVPGDRRGPRAAARRSTTATSSTRSWTPAYRSAKAHAWEPVELEWRGGPTPRIAREPETFEGQVVIKREILPDGRHKLILKDPATGDFTRPGRRRAADRATPSRSRSRRDRPIGRRTGSPASIQRGDRVAREELVDDHRRRADDAGQPAERRALDEQVAGRERAASGGRPSRGWRRGAGPGCSRRRRR